jgi:hypothetical protein
VRRSRASSARTIACPPLARGSGERVSRLARVPGSGARLLAVVSASGCASRVGIAFSVPCDDVRPAPAPQRLLLAAGGVASRQCCASRGCGLSLYSRAPWCSASPSTSRGPGGSCPGRTAPAKTGENAGERSALAGMAPYRLGRPGPCVRASPAWDGLYVETGDALLSRHRPPPVPANESHPAGEPAECDDTEPVSYFSVTSQLLLGRVRASAADRCDILASRRPVIARGAFEFRLVHRDRVLLAFGHRSKLQL